MIARFRSGAPADCYLQQGVCRRQTDFMTALWREIRYALRLLWSDTRAGEITLLAVALVIATGSLTTVGFFTDRVRLALTQQSNQLLGADLTIVSDRPFDSAFESEAQRRGLAVTQGLR